VIEDTEESRRLFEKLNGGTKGIGVVRTGDLRAVPVANGGHDTDVVNQKIPGADPNTTIHDGGGGRKGGAESHVVFWGNAWTTDPPPSPSAQDILNDIATTQRDSPEMAYAVGLDLPETASWSLVAMVSLLHDGIQHLEASGTESLRTVAEK
jgi:hypothetical protein